MKRCKGFDAFLLRGRSSSAHPPNYSATPFLPQNIIADATPYRCWGKGLMGCGEASRRRLFPKHKFPNLATLYYEISRGYTPPGYSISYALNS